MDKELAFGNLKELKDVLDEFCIEFWLDGGTLLGAVREGKIIEWDHDMDICMWNDDRQKLFLALYELKRRKGKLFLTAPLYPNVQAVSLSLFPFDCVIDIQLWQSKADKLPTLTVTLEGEYKPLNMIQRLLYLIQLNFSIIRHYLYCDLSLSLKHKPANFSAKFFERILPFLPKRMKKSLLGILQHWKLGISRWILTTPRHYFEKLETLNFYGCTFNIPSDVEDYLKLHYGENWRIPQKKWNWLEDDKAPPVKNQ
jgi:phosphorylcholine metabolism protein LicD